MENGIVSDLPGGTRASSVRNRNERLVLSVIQRNGALPGAQVARVTGLSAQTASVIARSLERDGLVRRGQPVRGKVGKPSIPLTLNPDGAFSIGLRIGRRSANLVLLDLSGAVRGHLTARYDYPTPDVIRAFMSKGYHDLLSGLSLIQRERLTGIGVAAPNELWNWLDAVGAPTVEMSGWRTFDFHNEWGHVTDLPVEVGNDGTLACTAEHIAGRGRQFIDYAYFFVGSFTGGGIALNGMVYPGRQGYAGALGSIPVREPQQPGHQLIQNASLYLLEREAESVGLDMRTLFRDARKGEVHPLVDKWLAKAGRHIASAIVSATSVIDFQAVFIDGNFPEQIRTCLTEIVIAEVERIDTQGLQKPRICEGTMGPMAGAVGAAYMPLLSRYLMNSSIN